VNRRAFPQRAPVAAYVDPWFFEEERHHINTADWQDARPCSAVRELTVGLVTHRWREVGSTRQSAFNVIRELAELTTIDGRTFTVEARRLRHHE
jgi:hypothetical protein